jgi:glycosyltransferase involved in cell wall biosynthesis
VPSKQIEVLIQAVTLVKKKIPDIQCNIIGTGPQIKTLQKLTRENNTISNVHFYEGLPTESVLQKVARSHIFCLPSSSEGFGLSVVEAMACSIPVVISDIPPLREIIQFEKGGFLTPVGDSIAIADRIIQLLTHSDLYSQKAREALSRAYFFNWSITVDRVEKLLEEIVHKVSTAELSSRANPPC